MSDVLVIGHTKHDSAICKEHGMGRGHHPPAPTTLLHENWQDFDGDIITCHSQHYGARYVCAIEVSPRFCASDGTLVLAEDFYNERKHMRPVNKTKRQMRDQKIISFKPGEFVGYDSGMFAVWFACWSGYDNIYTVGIDKVDIETQTDPHSFMRDNPTYMRGTAIGIIRNYRIDMDWYHCMVDDMKQIKENFPLQKIYKSHWISMLPADDIECPLCRIRGGGCND